MNNFKRYKITEIPNPNYGFGSYGYREVQVITGWSRFGHYIIDYLILQGVSLLINYGLGLVKPEFTTQDQEISFQMKLAGIGILENLLYYGLFEGFFSSTPGKMILGRLVIDEYGERPDAGRVAIRTLCRLIPFEAISCLWPRGWHDTMSRTFVVDKAEADELWELLAKVERDTAQRDAEFYRSQQGPTPQ